MKQYFLISLMACMISSSAMANQAPPPDTEVQVGINNVFVPDGLDSRTDSYVVVSGIFQNGCYHWNRADVTNKNAFVHEIRSIASVSPGMCIMVLIPFQKDVHLGMLAPGNHTLNFISGDSTYLEKVITVK